MHKTCLSKCCTFTISVKHVSEQGRRSTESMLTDRIVKEGLWEADLCHVTCVFLSDFLWKEDNLPSEEWMLYCPCESEPGHCTLRSSYWGVRITIRLVSFVFSHTLISSSFHRFRYSITPDFNHSARHSTRHSARQRLIHWESVAVVGRNKEARASWTTAWVSVRRLKKQHWKRDALKHTESWTDHSSRGPMLSWSVTKEKGTPGPGAFWGEVFKLSCEVIFKWAR